jgi:hypothetical protein
MIITKSVLITVYDFLKEGSLDKVLQAKYKNVILGTLRTFQHDQIKSLWCSIIMIYNTNLCRFSTSARNVRLGGLSTVETYDEKIFASIVICLTCLKIFYTINVNQC